MLQALRDKTSGWIAIAIVAVLAVPFAFFGMEQYLFQNNADYAAKVEAPPKWWQSAPDWWLVRKFAWSSAEVSAEEFRQTFDSMREQRRQQEGEAFDARAFETMESKREVLEQLIDRAVLGLAADRANIVVGDAQVQEIIQSIPAFQVEGRFDPQRYQMALQSTQPPRTPREFQEGIRIDLQRALVPQSIAETAFVTTGESTRLMRLLGERRDVSFVVVPPLAVDAAEVSQADQQAWYESHAARYREPEKVALEYVELKAAADAGAENATVDEAEARAHFEQVKSRFATAERRRASHILVEVPAGADEATQQAAQKKAADIAAKAQAPGADFAALARENSDDPGSKDGGGDLGWVEKGMMAGAFEDALFAMQPNAVSAPVRTDFGWHVLQLREVDAGKPVAFEDVREQMEKEVSEGDSSRVYNEQVGRFVDEINKNPMSLEPAAAAGGVQIQTIAPFARGAGSGIAANNAVVQAAFSEALTQDGTVSDPIEIGPNQTVFIRVTSHTPERAQPLAQVSERVIAEVRADRARKQAEQAADAMVAEIKGGKTLQALAGERQLQAQDVPGIPRGAPVPDASASQAYFRAAPPTGDTPTPGKVMLADGSSVVFAVTKVEPGKPEDASEQEQRMLRQQLGSLLGSEDAEIMQRSLRREMKITVNEARL
ncbi:peptidyl-prolyl cis-trans isomerase [Luteimonas fraxinea]|uniref:Periplasmic chaperone PpiD n=1 Tax=Luteimonas fraxinea TaxID=2901869 RepID=A0ABS8UE70_9GAMM|nr:SurA N-terminal domain-containing protein [Luteimonas fraxinea]MCD9097009.1 peptidyl-prolyl cis-trans isomerase [Luteimonas fraxinea]UHH09617.1 peptidyl-prolyl cis-trans isomerase [Luteimonas fraxinea]